MLFDSHSKLKIGNILIGDYVNSIVSLRLKLTEKLLLTKTDKLAFVFSALGISILLLYAINLYYIPLS